MLYLIGVGSCCFIYGIGNARSLRNEIRQYSFHTFFIIYAKRREQGGKNIYKDENKKIFGSYDGCSVEF